MLFNVIKNNVFNDEAFQARLCYADVRTDEVTDHITLDSLIGVDYVVVDGMLSDEQIDKLVEGWELVRVNIDIEHNEYRIIIIET